MATTQETDSNSLSSAPIDIQRVRYLFNRPSRTQNSDFMLREVASRMVERLALIKLSPSWILDAGCAEGADVSLLGHRYPKAEIVGLDASCTRIAKAHINIAVEKSFFQKSFGNLWTAKRSKTGQKAKFIVGNFAECPFSPRSFDLLWSNLALHWHPHPDLIFKEWLQVMRPNGLLMFSCFGPDTFKELRDVFRSSQGDVPVLPFVDMHDLGDMLVDAGFQTPVMDMERITVTYDSVHKLLKDVKAFGGNPLRSRQQSLKGKQWLVEVTTQLEFLRQSDGKLPLTFEILYGHAFVPIPSKLASGESIIHFLRKE